MGAEVCLSEDKIGQSWMTATNSQCLLQIRKSAKGWEVDGIREPEIIVLRKFC